MPIRYFRTIKYVAIWQYQKSIKIPKYLRNAPSATTK
jgi:hypothetical protein